MSQSEVLASSVMPYHIIKIKINKIIFLGLGFISNIYFFLSSLYKHLNIQTPVLCSQYCLLHKVTDAKLLTTKSWLVLNLSAHIHGNVQEQPLLMGKTWRWRNWFEAYSSDSLFIVHVILSKLMCSFFLYHRFFFIWFR